jgi:CheY-like chemotaxis protein
MFKVGLLEDHDDARLLFRCWLEMNGFSVQEWSDGETFLRDISNNQLDIVMADLWLPDLNGFTIPAAIKMRRQPIPAIAVSAHALAGVREQALQAGFVDYIRKPVDLDALLAAIRRVLT